ncbi:hypothetical protein Athai_08600 [Actinocatenispora thailandica]|uniref:Uncharacterized protein n=1 Tax=Actinocatenispora thailandica TaxID=227318 RepID=A0A7R7DKN1_9ACTN|nr:hypothetical protein Athai_08600 [Actinocatenispora thailandica]
MPALPDGWALRYDYGLTIGGRQAVPDLVVFDVERGSGDSARFGAGGRGAVPDRAAQPGAVSDTGKTTGAVGR